MKGNNVENPLSAVHELVEVILTTPVSTVGLKSCFNILKREKTYFGISMGQKRLNGQVLLNIHKDITADNTRFKQRVIELFTCQK